MYFKNFMSLVFVLMVVRSYDICVGWARGESPDNRSVWQPRKFLGSVTDRYAEVGGYL